MKLYPPPHPPPTPTPPHPPAAQSFPKEVVRVGVQDDLHIKGKPNQRSTAGPVERIRIENRRRIVFIKKKQKLSFWSCLLKTDIQKLQNHDSEYCHFDIFTLWTRLECVAEV